MTKRSITQKIFNNVQTNNLKEEEIELVLTDLHELHGYDFNDYARASLYRRINRLFILDRFPSFAEFRYKLRYDPDYFQRFIESITVNVTEMFRDPLFFKAVREILLPQLAVHSHIRIWHAGCSTGEEVYSMAILLHEAGLLKKSLLYATDINPQVLEKAHLGIFPLSSMKLYSENYLRSGGEKYFSSYYSANYNKAKFNEIFRSRMIFSTHNLVSDRSFNEFHLIICRNVLIYFNKELQEKALKVFDNSLNTGSFLALGSKENIRFSSIVKRFVTMDRNEKIWKKIADV